MHVIFELGMIRFQWSRNDIKVVDLFWRKIAFLSQKEECVCVLHD